LHFNEMRMSATKPNSPVWMARVSLSIQYLTQNFSIMGVPTSS
jgi:hypothetical protein